MSATVAIASLAFGIGANAALFSVAYTALIRKPLLREPRELVAIWETNTTAHLDKEPTSTPNFLDWRSRASSFATIAATTASFGMTISDSVGPDRVVVAGVSEGFFSMLGARPIMGRDFLPENHRRGHLRVILLSYRYWRTRYGGQYDLLGTSVVLNDKKFLILGVMPPHYRHPDWNGDTKVPDMWIPVDLPLYPDDRRHDWLQVIARLKPGTQITTAQAEMDTVSEILSQQYSGSNALYSIHLKPLQDALVGNIRKSVAILSCAVVILLLSACLNVAHLQLSRYYTRLPELSIRSALGAGPMILIRQILTEIGVLTMLGGLGGLALATWVLQGISKTWRLNSEPPTMDWRVFLFGLGVSVLATAVAGFLPSLRFSRLDLNTLLRAGAQGTSRRAVLGLRTSLISIEIALSMVLLVGFGLLTRSLEQTQAVSSGFTASHLLTADVQLPVRQYSDDTRTAALLREYLSRVQRLPGVQSVGAVSSMPLSNTDDTEQDFQIPGTLYTAGHGSQRARVNVCTPAYFEAMQIPLLLGRKLEVTDTHDSVPVALINATFARRYFTGVNPLERSLKVGEDTVRIIGVMADVRQTDLISTIKPQIYLPHSQRGWDAMTITVRAYKDPSRLIAPVRNELRDLDKTRPITNFRTGEELLSESVAEQRYLTGVFAAFAFVAFGLSLAGVYGLTSLSATQQRRDLGIRLAVGASRTGLILHVLRQSGLAVLLGLIGGTLIALSLSTLLKSVLFNVPTTDPVTFGLVIACMGLTTVVASLVPAMAVTGKQLAQSLRIQ